MSTELIEESFDEAEQVWAPVIGLFILEFATIEDFLHTVISWYLKDKHVTELDLKEGLPSRLTLFKKILLGVLETQQDRAKLESSVEGIRKLVDTRNLLAHNSLSLELEESKEGTLRAVGPIISGRRNPNNSITLSGLRSKLVTLKRHRDEMADLLAIFHRATFK